MMNYLIWNSRGVGGKTFVPLLIDLRRFYKLGFMAILEPRQKGSKAENMRKRLGFDEVEVVETNGFSGGIWIFWEKKIGFQVIEKHDQVVHGVFNAGLVNEWGMSIVYGSPNIQKRRVLWEMLGRVRGLGIQRWCYCGDFNATLYYDDRLSRSNKSLPPDRWFKDWVSSSYLKEMVTSGPKYTWGRNGCSSKIDWVLTNEE